MMAEQYTIPGSDVKDFFYKISSMKKTTGNGPFLPVIDKSDSVFSERIAESDKMNIAIMSRLPDKSGRRRLNTVIFFGQESLFRKKTLTFLRKIVC
jgi:hypothetical protein